jgi:GNAT superfamily N-acetyltransferase
MDEVFGTEEQRGMLTRGRALYALVAEDPRFTYYGRGVGVLRGAEGGMDLLDALVRLQGYSNLGDVADEDVAAFEQALEARGYSLTRYMRWVGGDTALAAAERVLDSTTLPPGTEVLSIGADSPPEHLEKLARVALDAGVLPNAGSVLRGRTRPGIGLVAVDAQGRPMSCAAAAAIYHPDDPQLGRQCWWGMLATDPGHRGKGLAAVLGAMAMQAMHARYGFTSFFTGVQPGNAASETVCGRMGLAPENRWVITVVDAAALPGGKLTR